MNENGDWKTNLGKKELIEIRDDVGKTRGIDRNLERCQKDQRD